MQPEKPRSYRLCFNLIATACLVSGILGYVPSITPRSVVLADPMPPPPSQVEQMVERQPEWNVQPPTPTPSKVQSVDREREAEVQAGLAALEAARQISPEAVVALLDTLRGEALDLAMDEIVEAMEQLAQMAPPRPATQPISPAEEEAALQAQLAVEAANRARALSLPQDLIEARSRIPNPPDDLSGVAQILRPTRPAADLTVGDGCTYPTITDAITASIPGDRLLIEGGRTFTENLVIPISITLQGGYDGCASGSTARTTIDGNASSSVVQINGGLSVTLEGLIISNGSIFGLGGGIDFASGPGTLNLTYVDVYTNTAFFGGGLAVGEDAEVVGTNVEIYDNGAIGGGGVYLLGGRATFSNSNIRDNTAFAGGGVLGIASSGYYPSLNLPFSADVHHNQALTGDGFGGGVYMSEGTVSLTNGSDIRSNDAIQGGGAYLITTTLTIAGDASEIQSNTATGDGGGIYAQSSTINLDDGAWLNDNDVSTGGTGDGGGAYLDNSGLYSDRASIRFNTAAVSGGGVYATNTSIVNMDLGSYPCTGPRCSQLSDNTATSGFGGGVYALDSAVWLNNIFVENNTATLGGGVYASSSAVYAYNNLFAENNATSSGAAGGDGDGVRFYIGASMNGVENTLAYNDAGGAATGNALGVHPGAGTLTMTCSIIWGHTTSIGRTGDDITYSDVEGGYTGTDNLDTDPLFVDPASNNFHLQGLSPVIDRCTGGLPVDFDNEPRPVTYVRPATPYDMGADEASVRVGINGAGCAYGRIQDAVDAAISGDTIQARADVFSETVDIIKTLAIAGGYDDDCTTYITSTSTVDGSDSTGSVFDVTSSTITLRDLDITGGDTMLGGGVDARDGAQVMLDNSNVFGNQASYGGGVYVDTNSAVTLTNNSDVHDNTATAVGGGARVWGTLVGADTPSDIFYNTAPDGGGVAVSDGTLILNGSDMYGNQATGAQGKGGGIYVIGGVVTMTNSAYVYFLNQAYDGAGLYADAATVYLVGSGPTFRQNIAANYGGGVYLSNNSVLYSTGARIGQAGATLANEAVRGAGVYAITSTVNFGGRIVNNVASDEGAGIYAEASTLDLSNAQVGGTDPYEANQLSSSNAFGAGMYLGNGTRATLDNTVVISNTFSVTAVLAGGGGAYVTAGSALTLTNSRIERHVATGTNQGRGGGIYVDDSAVTLNNSQVVSNTASTNGGGVRMWGNSTLNVLNGSSISHNEALNDEGGGVAAASGMLDINISNSTLEYNVANTDGGAIYLSAGTLDLTGGWDVLDNTCGGNGGAIAVTGSGDVDLATNSNPGQLLDNHAGGHGGALYVGNTDTIELYATTDPQIYLSSNTAGGDGGAAYAGNGGAFDVLGGLWATLNTATGNGGVFYLAGGSRLWLNDTPGYAPRIRINYADNGGAVYASDSSQVECDGASFGRTDTGNRATSGSGGAVYLSGSVITSTNCVFRNNRATGHGGAIGAYTSTLTIEADYSTCDPIAVKCSNFYSNTADSDANDDGHGGAIHVDDSTLQMDHTYLHRNRGVYGGAIHQIGTNAAAVVNNTLIYSNTSTNSIGGIGSGIRASGGSFTMTHVTLANNVEGAAYSQPISGVSSAALNSIAWGNDIGFMRTFVITSCNIDQSDNVGIAVDPQFVAAGSGEDYHLLGRSPAIDACVTGLSPDLDDVTRPVGGGYDVGVYEYAYGVEFAPNRSGSGEPSSVVIYTHTLTNTGGSVDTYALTAQSSQGWTVTTDPAPTVMLDSGLSTPVTITINVPAGVPSGTVDTTVVTATSGGDPSLTACVTDTTTIVSAPDIVVTPLALSTALNPDDALTLTLTIENAGTDDLTWSLAEIPARAWLSEDPTGDTTVPAGATSVDVVFDTTGLTDDVYSMTLEITSNDPDEPQVDVPVTLTVQSGCIPVSGASFVYDPTSPGADETVTFTGSVAQGTLPITYTWDFDDGTFGSGQAAIHAYGLGDTYNVVMTATNSCPSQDTATQAVVVTGEADIAVDPLALSAILNPGDAVTRTLTVGNAVAATADLTWNLAENPAQSWLSENPTGGAITPAGSTPVDVVFDAAGVLDGVYTTTLQVTSDDPDESTVDVSVVLTVTSACIPVDGADFGYAPPAPVVSETITFTGSVMQGTLPITYTWDFDDTGNGSGQIVAYTYAISDTYSVVMTATNACPSQDVAIHDVAVVELSSVIYLPLVVRNYF